jgi:cyclic lactone autoinducer peptide
MKATTFVGKKVTAIVKKAAVSASRSVSIGGYHQPKEPKALKK